MGEKEDMYDFLYSEVFWMETVLAAAITAIATIIAVALVYNYKIKTVYEFVKKALLSRYYSMPKRCVFQHFRSSIIVGIYTFLWICKCRFLFSYIPLYCFFTLP